MPEITRLTDQIFTVSDFLSAEECESYIRLAESIGFTNAPITTAYGPMMMPDMRNNTRVMLDDPVLGEQLWKRASGFLAKSIGDWHATGVNERFRFYRYELGQQFNWHYDGAFERDNGECSRLTFMLYLNDDFQGGQTSFETLAVTPKKGLALFFVHQLRHKGQPVNSGRKYVLRTDVMYRYEPGQHDEERLRGSKPKPNPGLPPRNG